MTDTATIINECNAAFLERAPEKLNPHHDIPARRTDPIHQGILANIAAGRPMSEIPLGRLPPERRPALDVEVKTE